MIKFRVLRYFFITFLLLKGLYLEAQSTLDQSLSIHLDNELLSESLLKISDLADVSILFNNRIIRDDKLLNFNFQNESLKAILKQCLKNTGLGFKLEDQRIVLFKQRIRRYTLSGFIQDAQTGERLIAANLWNANQAKGTSTNAYGFFSLILEEGLHELQFSYLGYQTQTKKIDLKSDQNFIIELKASFTLPEIVVNRNTNDEESERQLAGQHIEIDIEDIRSGPALVGEADVFQHLQSQPGIQNGPDGIGGIHIRGGNADQNLVLLDGVPIYNASHTLGLFSVFNPMTIKKVDFYKDGFSSNFNGRLSSVIDVRTREGSTRAYSTEAEISSLATKLVVEGPIIKEKSGFLLSLRRTHIDPVVRALTKKQKNNEGLNGEADYYFYDINAKVHTSIGLKDRLYLSFYKGKDDYENVSGWEFSETDFEDLRVENTWNQIVDYGNTITSLRWNHLFSDRLFSNTTATFSRFNYNSKNGDDYYEYVDGMLDYQDNYFTSFQSLIEDFGIRTDLEFYPNAKHKILFGGGITRRSFEPGLIKIEDDFFTSEIDFEDISIFSDSALVPTVFKATEYDFYLEDQLKINNQLEISLGFSSAFFQIKGKTFFSPQPRFRLHWKAPKIWSAKLSFSRMSQFLHVLTNSGSGFPSDLWVPSIDSIGPQHSYMAAFTIAADFKNGLGFSLGTYFKRMDDLLNYREEATLPTLFESSGENWQEQVTQGNGRSYGVECAFYKKKGSTTGQLSYTYSQSFRTFETINGGEEFPYRFNHIHNLNINLKHQFNKQFQVQAAWQFGSGQPITLVASPFRFAPLDNLFPAPNESLSSTNGYRLPAYHRLDFSAQYSWQKQKFHHSLSLGVFNVYNRKNPYYVYQLQDFDFPDNNGLKQQNALPVLPSLTYRIKIQ